MTKLKIFLALSMLTLLAGIPACTKDVAIPDSCDEKITWEGHIHTLFQNNCTTGQGPGTGCHDAWIGEYDNVKDKVDNGTLEDMVIVTRLMPEQPNAFGIDQLTEEEIQMVQCWIDLGAPKK